jgi:hypothetical protein
MSRFRRMSHVKEINMPKNMFGCPLKFILGFFGIFYIYDINLKDSYTITYDCEKSPFTHELSYIELFNFSHLILFHVNVISKKYFKKILKSFFSFFGTPTMHGPYNNLCMLFARIRLTTLQFTIVI